MAKLKDAIHMFPAEGRFMMHELDKTLTCLGYELDDIRYEGREKLKELDEDCFEYVQDLVNQLEPYLDEVIAKLERDNGERKQ